MNGGLSCTGQRIRWLSLKPLIILGPVLLAGSLSLLSAQVTLPDPPKIDVEPSEAQKPNSSPDQQKQAQDQKATETSRRGSLVGAPIPLVSPAIGNGVTVLGAYIFPLRRSDKVSPPSVIGGVWAGTDNGTRAWAFGAEFYFNQNRYRLMSGAAHADLNYQFYGIGTIAGDAGQRFGLNQTGDVFFGELLRRTFWKIFIGPRAWLGTSKITPQHLGETFPDLPPLDVDLSMRSVGLKIERKTVPNRFYPEAGTSFEFGSDFFSEAIGSTFTFQRYRMTFNSYHSLGTKQVLAYNLFGCTTGGTAPFFGECIFGLQGELRGYPAGRYIDRTMLATQVEYRRVMRWHLGFVVFGGFGEVAPSFSDYHVENILGSVGIGPRLTVSKKYHVNLRGDFAWGKNGHTFSMGIGESF